MNPEHHMIAGVLAGISASLCCVGSLLLLSPGLGGSWLASLAVLAPARPIFLALALLFIGLAFRQLYGVTNPLRTKPAVSGALRHRPTAPDILGGDHSFAGLAGLSVGCSTALLRFP